ncbi:DUF6085 family protein [Streptomyces umbrinus]|uniref:DUF6085 family protein n=1 Tax=Streptomyces umbrinus TaxID=67370 RepID=UPI003C2C0509
MSTVPSADAKAVVRALEGLTTQVRRLADTRQSDFVLSADALDDDATTPRRSINAADVQGFCPACGHGVLMLGDGGHVVCTLIDCPDPDAVDTLLTRTDDEETTGSEALRARITKALSDEWEERVLDRVMASPQEHITAMSAAVMRVVRPPMDPVHILGVEAPAVPDFSSPIAGNVEVRKPCPYCGDRQMIPTTQYDEHVSRLHPDVRTGGPGADEEQTLRLLRRESLLVLLTRLQRGRTLTETEASALRQHVETEIREADAARAEEEALDVELTLIRRALDPDDERYISETVDEQLEMRAAIDRVRALLGTHLGPLATAAVQRALDGTEQPTTEQEPEPSTRNFAAYQAAIARVALVLREAREHREQTDPSERQDCVMCGADHFAEIRDAIKGWD